MKPAQEVLIRPLITEKGTLLSDQNKYLFAVALDATKIDVRRAVEQTFDVTVLAVNVVNVPGKEKRLAGTVTGRRAGAKQSLHCSKVKPSTSLAASRGGFTHAGQIL